MLVDCQLDCQLDGLIELGVTAQPSQGNELEADAYRLECMSGKRFDRRAALTALDKMATMRGSAS